MKRLLVATALLALLVAGPAAASPTVRLAIAHTFRGCHVWTTSKMLGPSTALTVKRGTAVSIRVNCPMDFDFSQTGGPPLALGDPRTHGGTVRTIVFRKRGVYRFAARNVQSSEEMGLQTLGADNALTLVVRVR